MKNKKIVDPSRKRYQKRVDPPVDYWYRYLLVLGQKVWALCSLLASYYYRWLTLKLTRIPQSVMHSADMLLP